MSCENPTNAPDALMPRKSKYDKSKTCVRCKERRGNIVTRHAVYCRQCFVPLMTHKFRRSLEPYINSKPDGPRRTALKPTGDLLIGFSGGLGSSVLLDLVHRFYVCPDPGLVTMEGGKDHPRNERVWQKVTVCYVEVSDALPGTKDRTEAVREVVSRLEGVDFLPLRIQDAFDPMWWKGVSASPACLHIGTDFTNELLPVQELVADMTPTNSLRSYLASLPTSTALPSALHTLVRLLLQYTALQTGCSHVLLGTSLTSLAVSLIASVAQGGGFHLKEEGQEEWFPDPSDTPEQSQTAGQSSRHGVRVIRPLRDVGMKECAIWAWWMHLPILGREKWRWPGAKPDLSRLTKDFIVGLEKDYPSTVSTIVRTCGKLAPKGDTAGKCLICQRPVQSGVQDWKTRIAIRSTILEDAANIPVDGPLLAPYLCYVCHTTFTSKGTRSPGALYSPELITLPTSTPLPTWTVNGQHTRNNHYNELANVDQVVIGEATIQKKLDRSEMRDALEEFLLDD